MDLIQTVKQEKTIDRDWLHTIISKGQKVNLCPSTPNEDSNNMLAMWDNCFDSNGQLENTEIHQTFNVTYVEEGKEDGEGPWGIDDEEMGTSTDVLLS